jgi:hypothetical protein
MPLPNSNWSYPTTIWFGNGRIAELAGACAELGISRPLLVTDEALVKLPMVASACDLLTTASIDVHLFSDVQGNPTGANVAQGIEVYRQYDRDGVVALGGGSAIDAAKAIALMVGQSRSIWDFEDRGDNWKRANSSAIAPIIAIPTTAGTGSEVGRAAVILDQQAHCKKIIYHPRLMPAIVISDPELTVGLPPRLTAWTGVDALVHCLEAYCAPGFHPMADGIAIEAIRMICAYLPQAVADGTNLRARGKMLVAASMGATAFQKGLGSIHAVSHQLGALYDVHHGLANAIVLPYALVQNAPAIETRMAHLCQVLQIANPGTTAMLNYLLAMREQLGIPHTLDEIGIDDSRAVEIGKMAFHDPCAAGNAKPISAPELERLFRAAHSGNMGLVTTD